MATSTLAVRAGAPRPGDRVRITDGPYKGEAGLYIQNRAGSMRGRFVRVVQLDCGGEQVYVVNPDWLQRI